MIYYTFTHKEALMIKHFRIHGDNIVECERLFNLITKSIQTQKAERYFLSPACPSVKITTIDSDILFLNISLALTKILVIDGLPIYSKF